MSVLRSAIKRPENVAMVDFDAYYGHYSYTIDMMAIWRAELSEDLYFISHIRNAYASYGDGGRMGRPKGATITSSKVKATFFHGDWFPALLYLD